MPTSSDLNTDKPSFLELISQFLGLLVSLLDSYQASVVHPPVEARDGHEMPQVQRLSILRFPGNKECNLTIMNPGMCCLFEQQNKGHLA
jgi:hypothetical protein